MLVTNSLFLRSTAPRCGGDPSTTLQASSSEEPRGEGVDDEGAHGGSSEACKPQGCLGESKTARGGQEARSWSEATDRVQEVRQGEVLVLHLLHQQQDTHQHLDRPDLADQAEHHV